MVSIVVPNSGWFIRENPIYKWMMTGGTPIYGHLRMETGLWLMVPDVYVFSVSDHHASARIFFPMLTSKNHRKIAFVT